MAAYGRNGLKNHFLRRKRMQLLSPPAVTLLLLLALLGSLAVMVRIAKRLS